MSSTDSQRPGPSWGTVAGAVIVTIALLVGGWFLVQALTGDEGTQSSSAPSPPSAPSSKQASTDKESSKEESEKPSYKSACGLAGGETAMPKHSIEGVDWAHANAWPLPVSEQHGPGQRSKTGPWSCFSQTPSGAVIAGYTISMRLEGVAEDWKKVVKTQTVPGVGQDARLASGPTTPTNGVVTPRGFHIEHYSAEAATIRYVLQDAGGSTSACSVDLKWQDNDWKVDLQQDGVSVWGCTSGPPPEYTRWGPA